MGALILAAAVALSATARVESMVEIDETDDGSIVWRTNGPADEAWVGVDVAGELYALEAGRAYDRRRLLQSS